MGNLTRMVAAMTNSAPGDTQEGKLTDVGMDVDPMEKTMAEKGGGIRLPVSAKLIAGFGVVLLLTIVAGVMAISSLSSLNGDAQEILEVDLESVLLVAAIEEEGLTVEELMTKGVLAALMAAEIHDTDPAGAAHLEEEAAVLLEEAAVESEDVTHKIEELRASGHLGTTELLLLSDVEDNWNVFLLELDEVLLDEEAGLTFEAGEAVLSGEGEEAFALFVQELEELAADIEAAAAHSAEQAHNTYTSSRTIVLALLIVAVAIGMGVAGYLSWSISKGTKRIAETLRSLESGEITSLEGGIRALAEGDLTAHIEPSTERMAKPSNDEIGDAARAANDILTRIAATMASYDEARVGLGQIIATVQSKAGSITGAAEQLGGASDQMAAATGQISAAIAEVTTSATSLSELAQASAREVEQVAAGSQQLSASSQSDRLRPVLHPFTDHDVELGAHVDAHRASLARVLIEGVVAPAAVERVRREILPRCVEDLAEIGVEKLLLAGKGARLARLDHRCDVHPGAVEAAEVIAVDARVAGRLGDPATLRTHVHRLAAVATNDEGVLAVDVLLPGELLFETAGGAGQVVVALIGLEEEGVDARLGVARRRGDKQAAALARSEPLLRQLERALGHLVELVENDEVGIEARDLASAIGAAQVDIATTDALEALGVRALAPWGLWLQARTQMGAVLERTVDARLGEVVHLVLGGHEVGDVAAPRPAHIRRPERHVHHQLGRAHLGRLLDHDEVFVVTRDVGEGVEVREKPVLANVAVSHRPGPGIIRIPAGPLPPDRPQRFR